MVATLAIAGGVLGADAGLRAREAQRSANLLGQPNATEASVPATTVATPPPASMTPETTPVTTVPKAAPVAGAIGEAQYYKDTAKRLQETLDDPQQAGRTTSRTRRRSEYDEATVQPLDLKDVPVKGSAEAPVQVVGYSDFLCPFCRNLAGALAQFHPPVRQSGGASSSRTTRSSRSCNPNVQQTVHPGACVLALGGICAQYQGKF